MEQCTWTLGLNIGIPIVMIRNWILVNCSGINWSLYLSLNCPECVGIWAETEGDSHRRKNGEVRGAGKNMEIPRWYAPLGGTGFAARRRRRHYNQVWWNKCWRARGHELFFYLDCGQVCWVGFYEITSSRKAWDVELIFLIWVLVIWLAWVHDIAWNKVLE